MARRATIPHMRSELYEVRLPEPLANGPGPALTVRTLDDKYVQIQGGTYSFSIALEFSIDEGETWHELLAATGSSVAPTSFPQTASQVRTVVSSFTSSTTPPKVSLRGWNVDNT